MTITGTGNFLWAGCERRSDRYGVIALDKTEGAGWSDNPDIFTNRKCIVAVEVLETRQSDHIGDLFRGIFPETPDVGEIIDLGTGTFFVERDGYDWAADGFGIGLRPDDGRENDWFDPVKLYRLHNQTVRITITPQEKTT